MFDFDIVSFIPRAVMQGIPLLYGSTGEILTEKSGNLNLGIPGIMYVGGICGVIGAFFYEQAVPANQMSGFLAIMIPMLCSLLGSLLMGLLYCFLTVTLRANQNVTGLTMTTFGVGIGNFFGGSLIKLTGSEVPSIALSATSGYFAKSLPFAKSLGWFGQIFLSYGFLAYLAIILALLTSYFLKHTRPGLHLRSVGESASTADAAGINVTRYKYLATCIGSMIAGLGGLYYVMDYASGVWSNNAFGDRGWLAIALVIFTIWRPNVSVLASILFGGLYILYLYIPTGAQMAVKELYKMLPYVVTVVVLVMAWGIVFLTGAQSGIRHLTQRSMLFLVLSGLATGASWLCYYRALQLGRASQVVSIDKLSVVITLVLAFVFLHEPFTAKSMVGCALVAAGTLFMVL